MADEQMQVYDIDGKLNTVTEISWNTAYQFDACGEVDGQRVEGRLMQGKVYWYIVENGQPIDIWNRLVADYTEVA